MEPSPEILEKFRKKAEAASAIVSEVDSMAQAVAYTVDLCAQKEACQRSTSKRVPMPVHAGQAP